MRHDLNSCKCKWLTQLFIEKDCTGKWRKQHVCFCNSAIFPKHLIFNLNNILVYHFSFSKFCIFIFGNLKRKWDEEGTVWEQTVELVERPSELSKKKNPWCSNCTHFGLFRFLEEVETKFLVPVAAHSGVEKFCSTKEMGIIKEVWKSFQEKGDIELGNIILQGPKLTKGKESLPAFLLQIWWWESSRSLKTLMKISQAIVSKG